MISARKINEDPMTGVPLITATADDSWDEISWDAAVSYDINDRLTTYLNIQSGYQSGQFPARPFCLFGNLDFTMPGNAINTGEIAGGEISKITNVYNRRIQHHQIWGYTC